MAPTTPTPITRESRGTRVEKFQKGIRKTLKGHGFDVWAKAVIVDGKPGPMTFKMARLAGSMQGLSEAQLRHIREGKVLRHAEEILTHQKERSADMKRRAKKRDERFDKIRHHILHPPDDPDHISTFEGVPVAAWMVGKDAGPDGSHVDWLQKIRDAGWHGVVVSGARTAAHSEELCFAMCGAPSCPGQCAGRSSNHVVDAGYPDGAVDVSEYTTFGQKAREVRAPLINDLPIDPVHYSPSGH